MTTAKVELEARISAVVLNFLQSQLGENASTVLTLLAGNAVAVRALDCLTPVEKQLAQNETDWSLLQHFKAQQFGHVQPMLKQKLEEITGTEVLNIVSSVDKDGLRFEIFTFKDDLERNFS